MGYNKRRNQESKDEAMFGYVRPHRGELLVREYQQYKAVYCQLCRQLGKDYGVLARLTLSYDCTFYAMLALGTQGDRVSRRRGRCRCRSRGCRRRRGKATTRRRLSRCC